jgi:hypothetical protein
MNNRTIQMYKEIYKKGTRIECISMDDPYSPIERGTKGTVVAVDDIGTIHMKWDNGRTLGLIYSEDTFVVIE